MPYTVPSGSAAVAGYHFCRSASPRMRKAPDRSMTRTPRSSSFGASSADAASGSARNTTSADATSWSTSSGVTVPFQMRLSAGSGRGALEAPDDMAAVSVTAGWRARMRTSSWPA